MRRKGGWLSGYVPWGAVGEGVDCQAVSWVGVVVRLCTVGEGGSCQVMCRGGGGGC